MNYRPGSQNYGLTQGEFGDYSKRAGGVLRGDSGGCAAKRFGRLGWEGRDELYYFAISGGSSDCGDLYCLHSVCDQLEGRWARGTRTLEQGFVISGL
jgi:hypothetical protein